MTKEFVDLDLTDLAFGGAAVGRLGSGKVLFVHRAAAGERVRARILRQKRSWAEAELVEVISASADRAEPACALASRCGGCGWMHLSIEAQRRWKRRLLTRELERAVAGAPELEPMITGAPLGFRTRCRLRLEGGQLGYRAARSHQLVPTDVCPILAPELERFLGELASAVDEQQGAAELELSVDAAGHRGLSVVARGTGGVRRWSELAQQLSVTSLALELGGRRRRATGPALIELTPEGELRYEPGLFVQTNREVNRRLQHMVGSAAGQGQRFVEVYAGVGNLTLALARRFERGLATEGDRRAAAALRRNLGAVAARRVQVVAEDDQCTAARLASEPPAELLVADPPRAGLKPLLPLLIGAPPRRLVMISCHPMAAIRDLATLVSRAGYRLGQITPLDMFPQTPHLELLAELERS